MITRELSHPTSHRRYWVTFDDTTARFRRGPAHTIAMVKRNMPKQPVPKMSACCRPTS